MRHPLQTLMKRRRLDPSCGMPSYCTANPIVLEAALEHGMRYDYPVLIEATANQVNQFGGYTGMRPGNFRDMVRRLADSCGIESERVILGGDHLGPLVWSSEAEDQAMPKAEKLVEEYVEAGFTKIHLDTSMRLANDSRDEKLSPCVVARRGARLCKKALAAFDRLQSSQPGAMRPVFVIGSEVPIPGGEQNDTAEIEVTRVEDFEETVAAYREAFSEAGIADAWEDVIAVVVQPGVEFGDGALHMYNPEKAKHLVAALRCHPELVFEGHSTDYQSVDSLRNMVRDGIAILKVGPALTFAFREALFALDGMERNLSVQGSRGGFIEALNHSMTTRDSDWRKYYRGDKHQLHLACQYSFSDRARYYLGDAGVPEAIEKLFNNLPAGALPPNVVRQYFPLAFRDILEGRLSGDAKSLAKFAVATVCETYRQATTPEMSHVF
jgi:Predicted tagatose 6-phosphate kinase